MFKVSETSMKILKNIYEVLFENPNAILKEQYFKLETFAEKYSITESQTAVCFDYLLNRGYIESIMQNFDDDGGRRFSLTPNGIDVIENKL